MSLQEAYVIGLEDGIRAYSWMKDGTTYVGTTGRTLAEALEAARTGKYPPQRDMTKLAYQPDTTGRL